MNEQDPRITRIQMIERILAYKALYEATLDELEDMNFLMYTEMSYDEVKEIYEQLD